MTRTLDIPVLLAPVAEAYVGYKTYQQVTGHVTTVDEDLGDLQHATSSLASSAWKAFEKSIDTAAKLLAPAPRKMPRFSRRKSRGRRIRRKSVRTRKRSRRKSVKQRASKRRRRHTMSSTRLMPSSQKMSFTYRGQASFHPNSDKWSVVKFPMNIMERPCGEYLDPSTAFGMKSISQAPDRQPDGYDRWLDTEATSGGATEGKYLLYRVENSTIKLTHLPSVLSDNGANYIGSLKMYFGEEDDTEIYRGLDTQEVTAMLSPGGKKIFGHPKIFNIGHLGHTWTGSWNRKAWNKKFPDRKEEDPLDQMLTHAKGNKGSGSFYKALARFTLGDLGPTTTANFNFLVEIKYDCTLTRPTHFGASADDTNAAGVYDDTTVL